MMTAEHLEALETAFVELAYGLPGVSQSLREDLSKAARACHEARTTLDHDDGETDAKRSQPIADGCIMRQ